MKTRPGCASKSVTFEQGSTVRVKVFRNGSEWIQNGVFASFACVASILVVENEFELRLVVDRGLRLHGYEVELAVDGAEALRKLAQVAVDLVIIDISKPTGDRIETIAQLRREFPMVPIIAISSHVDSGDSLAVAKHLRVRSTLQEPFSLEELVNEVSKVLQGSGPISAGEGIRRDREPV